MSLQQANGSPDKEELTFPDAVELALQLHRGGDLDGAEKLYRGVLDLAPDLPMALHFYGVLQHQRGRYDEALALIDRSLALSPDESGWHNNRGNTLLKLGREAEAEAAWRRSIALSPKRSDGYPSLEALLEKQGRIADLVTLHAEFVIASPEERTDAVLGRSYARLGRMQEAAAAYRRWLDAEPDNPVARHLYLAALGQAPERADDAYVARAFDNYADKFDSHIAGLNYRGPDLVAEAVTQSCGAPRAALETLDAGCGTGLCGPRVRPWASRLDGVDLAQKMLDRAAALGCYDELVCAELTAHLEARPGRYDLIISGDTLCYFGALERPLAAARAALKPGGRLSFTIEAREEGEAGYTLNVSGRYGHRSAYVAEQAERAGFVVERLSPEYLRNEGGAALGGYLVILARRD